MPVQNAPEIVHVGKLNPITAEYFKFLDERFDLNSHRFECLGFFETDNTDLPSFGRSVCGVVGWLGFARTLCRADKIILHGLFSNRLVLLLCFLPCLLPRCYWVMWGGDFMRAVPPVTGFIGKFLRLIRVRVIQGVGNLLTYLPGDLDLVRSRLGAKGRHFECIMYPSNVYSGQLNRSPMPPPHSKRLTFLVGNSADPSNEHIEVLEAIEKCGPRDVRIICPLSYGDPENAERVAYEGTRMFGERFEPLREFLDKDAYFKRIQEVDIVVFGHRRQQGMGNLLSLLGMGKTIYVRRSISTWGLFHQMGVKVLAFEDFQGEQLDSKTILSNRSLIEANFSSKVLEKQWRSVFES